MENLLTNIVLYAWISHNYKKKNLKRSEFYPVANTNGRWTYVGFLVDNKANKPLDPLTDKM